MITPNLINNRCNNFAFKAKNTNDKNNSNVSNNSLGSTLRNQLIGLSILGASLVGPAQANNTHSTI